MLIRAQAPCLQDYKGEVMLYTGKGQGISKVPVVINGIQGTPTDANGVFRYKLNKCPGSIVQIKLGSNRWDIVNHIEVTTYTIRRLADPDDFQFRLLVAAAPEIEKARRTYYAQLTGVALDKGLSSQKGEIEQVKLLFQQQLKEQRLIANQSKVVDRQPQVSELEKRLERQQKDYQRALDSLAKEPTQLTGRIDGLQKLVEKQKLENRKLLDSLARVPAKQQGRTNELEQILTRQQQENQQLLHKLAHQDSTRQSDTDKAAQLQKLLEQQKQENKQLLDRLAAQEMAPQQNRAVALSDSLSNKNQAINQLRDSLARMQSRYELALSERDKRLSEAQAMAAVFARQTTIDSSYHQAFLQYREGQFKGALSTLSGGQTPGFQPKNAAGASPDELRKERALYVSKALFKASIYRSQYDMEQAAHWYEEAIRADSSQVENLFTYANFLQMLNRPREPEYWYRKALALNPPAPLKADIYVELGYYYLGVNRYDEAETALLEARTLRQTLARTNAEQHAPGLAHVLDGLGTLYTQKKQYDEAEKMFVQAKDIREKLVEKYADEFEADLAYSLNNLGTFYYINKRLGDAGQTYGRAKTIQDRLVRRNADQYEPDLAATLGNMGTLNYELDRLSDAEATYKQARAIREKLAQKNPDQYEPGLAQILNNLGDLYAYAKRYPEAQDAYNQAKTVRERLAQKNPDQFEANLAQTLADMGNLYADTERYSEAEAEYAHAKTIWNRLVQRNADLFEPPLASMLDDVGYFYTQIKRYPEAEAAFQQARTIQEKFVQKKPKEFSLDLAYTLTDMGNSYYDTKRNREAKGIYVRAKEILEQLEPTDGGQLAPLLIKTLHRLALLSDSQEQESYFNEAASLQAKVVELAGKHYGDADSSMMARAYSRWSYHLVFSRKFAEAEAAAEKALSFDEHEEWANANLAMAYLMQGKREDAKTLYAYLLNKSPRAARYKKKVLADLVELEDAGLTKPDAAIIRDLIK